MASETQQEKALAYLAEGRIKAVEVTATECIFHAQGSDRYTTQFIPGVGWACTCPARKTECVHVYAAKLVTDFHVDPNLVKFTAHDEEIDDLLRKS